MAMVLVALLLATPAIAEPVARTPHPVADSGGESTLGGAAPKVHFTAPEAAVFAKQVERDLAAKDARVAIVFRSGRARSKLPAGIAYTHAAFWVYSDIKGADGQAYKGYAVYNLYEGDGASLPADQSYLAQDYPLDFMMANQVDDVAVIIPSSEMQARLLALIGSPAYERLHVPAYSLVSNPFDARYQNCTEFVLDVVSAAAWDTHDPAQIRADLRAWFKPTVIHANPLVRAFGPMFQPGLKMDDQPGPVETATYESIAAFMQQNHLIATTYVLKDN